jgi:hypothetical protein
MEVMPSSAGSSSPRRIEPQNGSIAKQAILHNMELVFDRNDYYVLWNVQGQIL